MSGPMPHVGRTEPPGDRKHAAPQYGGAASGLDMVAIVLAGILFWGGAGWLADRWLGSEPWLFAVGCLLGMGASLYLIYLRTNDEGPASGPARGGDEGADR